MHERCFHWFSVLQIVSSTFVSRKYLKYSVAIYFPDAYLMDSRVIPIVRYFACGYLQRNYLLAEGMICFAKVTFFAVWASNALYQVLHFAVHTCIYFEKRSTLEFYGRITF